MARTAQKKLRPVQRSLCKNFLETDTKFSKKKLKMVAGSRYIPKKNELKLLGKDAHFICPEEQTIGVADGVGGWAKKGVDAGEYARELMSNAESAVQDQSRKRNRGIDPKQVLNEAFLNTDNEGSSTACIVTLLGDFLHAVNIGDSGFVLIRGGRIVFASPSQQRRFNCPFQLGNTSDCPSLAAEFRVGVEGGDIVVVGTDGLFDNVFGRDIEDLVILGEQVGFCEDEPELLAQIIAKCALGKSKVKNGSTPLQVLLVRLVMNMKGEA